MLSLAQALRRRQSSGIPLPAVYRPLASGGANICRAQLTLITGPPGAGKSLFAMNLLAKMDIPALAFLLDTTELTASARFASILTGDPYASVKEAIISGNDAQYAKHLAQLGNVQACFHAPDIEDVKREVDAFEARYGLPPDVILLDNLGNQASAYADEWSALKAMTLELDQLARSTQAAVIATHHTQDYEGTEPQGRTKILGKVTQYARLVLSVGYSPATDEFRVAIVKNSEGKSDPKAAEPVILYCDPSRMLLQEYPVRTQGWQQDHWQDRQ